MEVNPVALKLISLVCFWRSLYLEVPCSCAIAPGDWQELRHWMNWPQRYWRVLCWQDQVRACHTRAILFMGVWWTSGDPLAWDCSGASLSPYLSDNRYTNVYPG